MKILSLDQYLALRADATVLERDLHGEKVLILKDGSYLKLFRRKRVISSAAWYPYAQRFADNALQLAQRGIPCPSVIDVYRIPDIARDAVQYWPLGGQTIRQLITHGEANDALRRQLFQFVDSLHVEGIYFRSLHLGNVVQASQNKLGLIDIADLQVKTKPLGSAQRQRNMRHLLRDEKDRKWLESSVTE